MRFEVRMFPDRRGETYLATFAGWVVCLVAGIVHGGGSGGVTDLTGGLLLTVDFACVATIFGLAIIITREINGRVAEGDPLQIAVLITLRCWTLLLGFGIPAALASLRGSS
jgi:hypothetical protein